MQLSKKRKILSRFSFAFPKLDSILNFFRKKMTLIADVFLDFWTMKNVVR